jgi:hypothetical protein
VLRRGLAVTTVTGSPSFLTWVGRSRCSQCDVVEAFGAGELGGDLSSFGIDRSLLVVGHVVLAPAERQVFIHGRRGPFLRAGV